MKKTGIIALLLCLALAALPMLGACAEEADLPEICQGIFEYIMQPEGRGDYVNYIHFYPSGVYYVSLYNGSQFTAGFYTITDEPMEYVDKEEVTHTAPQSIVMTAVDGTPYTTVAYDAELGLVGEFAPLYNNEFMQVKDSAHTSEDENGVAIIEYMLEDDEYSMLRIMHNGSFQDTVDALLEGTWSKDGDVYTLTDEDSGGSYTLTISEDGKTATYMNLDGDECMLYLVETVQEAVLVYKGRTDGAYGELAAAVECFEDNSLSMTLSYVGRETVYPGMWGLADNKMSMTLVIDNVTYEAQLNLADQSFAFEYTCSDGTKDVTFALSTAEEVTLSYVFTGEQNGKVILEMYSDGTCALVYEGMGTVTGGTWAIDTTSQLPAWTIALDAVYEGTETKVETDYQTKFFFTFKNAGGTLEETLALTFADWQAAQQ